MKIYAINQQYQQNQPNQNFKALKKLTLNPKFAETYPDITDSILKTLNSNPTWIKFKNIFDVELKQFSAINPETSNYVMGFDVFYKPASELPKNKIKAFFAKLKETYDYSLSGVISSDGTYKMTAEFLAKCMRNKDFGLYQKMETAIAEYEKDIACSKKLANDKKQLNSTLKEMFAGN